MDMENELVLKNFTNEGQNMIISERNNGMDDSVNDIDYGYTKDEMKNKCMKIFINFSSFSKKDKDYFLSQQSLLKILKGVNLIDDRTLKMTDIDILFKKVTSFGTRLNINQFLDYIVLLTQKIDPSLYNEDPRSAVTQFIKTFFEPFGKYLEKKSGEDNNPMNISSNNILIQNSIEQIIDSFHCDSKVYELINSVYYALKEIYLSYFNVELKPLEVDKMLPISFQGLLDFCKDFEITNYLCSINQIVIYWNVMLKTRIEDITKNPNIPSLIEEKKDMGTVFTLSKFTALLIYFSILTFNKYKLNSASISTAEIVLFFLEKLENSVGFQNLERRTNKPHSSKLTLIPQKEMVKALNQTINKTLKLVEENKKTEITEKLKEFNEKSKKPGEIINIKQLLSVVPEAYARVETKLDLLKDIFLSYSRNGNKLNNNKLTYSSYLKFLRDCRLIYDPKLEMLRKENKKSNMNSNNSSFIYDPKSIARSPLRTFNTSILSKSNSMKKITKGSVPPQNKKKKEEVKVPRGKILEIDAQMIFFKLTGFKNFDNSDRIRSQFDHNPGVTIDIDKNPHAGIIIDKSNRVKSNTSNVALKMDFCLFIKSFEFLGKKLHPERNMDQAFVMFIEKDLKKLFSENDQLFNERRKINDLLNSLKKGESVEVLKDIHPLVYPHYESYCSLNGLINFEQFFNFYKDFSIFPETVNLIQVKNVFFTLADIYGKQLGSSQQTPQNNNSRTAENMNLTKNVLTGSMNELGANKRNINKIEVINYELFMDSLAITANIMKNNSEFKTVDKILYLLELICHSEAVKKCLLKSGKTFYSSKDYTDNIYAIRMKYYEFYNKKDKNKGDPKPKKFEDIFA